MDGRNEQLVLPQSLLTLIGPQRLRVIVEQRGAKLTKLPLSADRFRVAHEDKVAAGPDGDIAISLKSRLAHWGTPTHQPRSE